MLSLEQALEQVLAEMKSLPAEEVLLTESVGRCLAEDVVAGSSLPLFDNSAMDGYAVRASDLVKATAASPVRLTQVGEVPAGQVYPTVVRPGECVRIFTGSAIPKGADTVVMQEDVQVDGKHPQARIEFCEPAKPWENLRLVGEDVKRGDRLLSSGTRLSAASLSILAATGVERVRVSHKPLVSLLASGSELRTVGDALSPGCIHESNRATLLPMIQSAGGIVGHSALIADDEAALTDFFKTAFTQSHVLISTGGVSVGDYDLLQQCFQRMGGTVKVWKIAIKPGKPFVFGEYGGRYWLGLPGNPVSAFVTFLLLARPFLLRMQGCAETRFTEVLGKALSPVHNRGDRRHFLRSRLNLDGTVEILPKQGSHHLSTLAKTNALLDLRPGASVEVGDLVRVLLIPDH